MPRISYGVMDWSRGRTRGLGTAARDTERQKLRHGQLRVILPPTCRTVFVSLAGPDDGGPAGGVQPPPPHGAGGVGQGHHAAAETSAGQPSAVDAGRGLE